MAARFQPQGDELGPQQPASNLLGSALVTFLCCLPFGLVAIVYGLQVGPKFRKGDYDGSQRASDMAERWMFAAVGAFILMLIVAGITYLLRRIFGGGSAD